MSTTFLGLLFYFLFYLLWQLLLVKSHDAHGPGIYQFRSSLRYISTVSASTTTNDVGCSAQTQMDSHADTIVAGKNFVVTNHTDQSCDVSPYTDAYEPMKNIRIVQAATGYTMTADYMTKPLHGQKFHKFKKEIMNIHI